MERGKKVFFEDEVEALKLDGITEVSMLKQSCSGLPKSAGVYVVLGNYPEMPEFLEKGTGPEFHNKKGTRQPMNYSVSDLERKWVDNTWIVYIGKTDNTLYKRISDYIKFGKGQDVAHRGGRAIWQLPDSEKLLIGWKIIEPPITAEQIEKEWLRVFKNNHNDKLPFANWRE